VSAGPSLGQILRAVVQGTCAPTLRLSPYHWKATQPAGPIAGRRNNLAEPPLARIVRALVLAAEVQTGLTMVRVSSPMESMVPPFWRCGPW